MINLTYWKRQAAARDLTANEVIKIIDNSEREIWRLKAALSFIANHTAEPDTPLATVVNFARLTLEEATP